MKFEGDPLTLPSQSRAKKKIKLNFIFILLCVASKGFIKVFIKPFEASQRSVKIEFNLIFVLIQLSEM